MICAERENNVTLCVYIFKMEIIMDGLCQMYFCAIILLVEQNDFGCGLTVLKISIISRD